MATYLLIKPINEVETVENAIVADALTAATYLVQNEGDYDYVLDISEYDPQPGIGWTYDPGENTFAAPPEDFEGELEDALNAVNTAIENAAAAYLAASAMDRSSAVSMVMSNISEEPQEEQDLMAALMDYLATLV